MSKKIEILSLLIILIIASFFRLWQLNHIPPGLYPDVAINGNEAWDTLKKGNFKVFYPENNGREGLWMWLIAFSFSIFGISVWSIKIVAALVGILTVVGLYLLTKELFNKKTTNNQIIAFLASFFLAISFWHVNFSRIGFRAILLPFVLVFAFYLLFKALNNFEKIKEGKKATFRIIFLIILGGIFFGLGFYTYTSFRMAVLILPFVFLFYWFIFKKEGLQKKFLLYSLYFIITIFIVALPIGIYFLQNPNDFFGRTMQTSVFSSENPLKELGKSLILHLAMFNFYGDPNWRHNFAGSPMFFWPVGILFLIGLFYSLKNFIKSLITWNKEKSEILNYFHYVFLILWWSIMLLGGVLTYEGIPHALRTIGTIPVVFVFVGLGGYLIYDWFNKNTEKKFLFYFTICLFLISTGIYEFNKYFIVWAKKSEVKDAFSSDYVKIGNYLNSLSEEVQKYVIVNRSGVPVPYPNGLPMPAQTPIFIEREKYKEPRAIYLLPEDLDKIKIEKEAVIIPMGFDEELFTKIQLMYPEGKIKKKDEIWLYEIK